MRAGNRSPDSTAIHARCNLMVSERQRHMGVLDPVRRNAEEMSELNQKYFDRVETTIDNLRSLAPAILNDRRDVMEEKDPFFFLIWRDEDVIDIESMDEIENQLQALEEFKRELSVGALESTYMDALADELDVEPDYQNPVQSYAELDELDRKLDGLSDKIHGRLAYKLGLDPDRFETGYDATEYYFVKTLYSLSDSIEVFPMLEAKHEAKENIAREKENVLSKAVDEQRRTKDSVDADYERAEIPTEPITWQRIIEEESLKQYMDVSGIAGVTYGDTLHMMMEELIDDVEGIEPEYPLHFRNTGDRRDTSRHTRLDNTLRPDAVGHLLVYEFKHMPKHQAKSFDRSGDLDRNEKFQVNVEQLNGYLNELDLPVGMLVQVSSEMDIKEYAVERHDAETADYEDFVYDRDDYDFDALSSMV